jgi:hypothetical protein
LAWTGPATINDKVSPSAAVRAIRRYLLSDAM